MSLCYNQDLFTTTSIATGLCRLGIARYQGSKSKCIASDNEAKVIDYTVTPKSGAFCGYKLAVLIFQEREDQCSPRLLLHWDL